MKHTWIRGEGLSWLLGGLIVFTTTGFAQNNATFVHVVVGPSQNGGTARSAGHVQAEPIVESAATVDDPARISGGVDPALLATHGARSVVIGHDGNEVESGRLHCVGKRSRPDDLDYRQKDGVGQSMKLAWFDSDRTVSAVASDETSLLDSVLRFPRFFFRFPLGKLIGIRMGTYR